MNDQKPHKLNTSLFSAQDCLLTPFLEQTQYPWELHDLLIPFFKENELTKEICYPSVHFKNKKEIYIGAGVTIEPGALIEGPCYIGEKVKIGHCALIRSHTFLAPFSYVGHCSEISRSILFEKAKAPHFNYVGDSILGKEVNLGAHAVLTNLRLDQKEVRIFFEREILLTGRRKFGSLVGDYTSIGASCILNPGTIVRKNSKIPPLTTHKGCI